MKKLNLKKAASSKLQAWQDLSSGIYCDYEKIHNKDSSKIFGYVHNCYEKNIGKIACLLNIHAKEFNEELYNLANNICMHIAAMKPLSLNIDQLDNDLIQKEEKILIETIKSDKNSNKKSSEVINKIVNKSELLNLQLRSFSIKIQIKIAEK